MLFKYIYETHRNRGDSSWSLGRVEKKAKPELVWLSGRKHVGQETESMNETEVG